MNYISTFFSWKGYSTRTEFLSSCFCILGLTSLLFGLPFLVFNLLDFPAIFTPLVFILAMIFYIYTTLAVIVKRLRHIGISPAWCCLFLVCVIPNLQLLEILFFLGLCLIPALKKSEAQNKQSQYIVGNFILGFVAFLIPFILLFSLTLAAKNNSDFLLKFPAIKNRIENSKKANSSADLLKLPSQKN